MRSLARGMAVAALRGGSQRPAQAPASSSSDFGHYAAIFGSAASLYLALKADNADVKASMAEFKADVKADNADVKQQLGKAEDRWLSVAQEGYSERRLVDFLKEQQLRTLVLPADKKPELP
ncbi:hypothetical protein HYH03_018329 [Edaphochlamys debaryana]|uniref:Uncharacterized protein n=1 Tax=Edaphochlamys debaryana TaxID=47281 RepID=A0A835XE23_9CHLO|nr:hypothetical protein HYH03_018329 [Edaphochlamys debaryana]|eukprot:KAG2482792.1 hypothetical protein HYH03_018329 [Edaphochlamys debaryana]